MRAWQTCIVRLGAVAVQRLVSFPMPAWHTWCTTMFFVYTMSFCSMWVVPHSAVLLDAILTQVSCNCLLQCAS